MIYIYALNGKLGNWHEGRMEVAIGALEIWLSSECIIVCYVVKHDHMLRDSCPFWRGISLGLLIKDIYSNFSIQDSVAISQTLGIPST